MSQLDWENTGQLGQAWDDECPHWMTIGEPTGMASVSRRWPAVQGHLSLSGPSKGICWSAMMLDHSEDRHKAEEQGEEASCSRQAEPQETCWLDSRGWVQKAATCVLPSPFSAFLGQARVDLEDPSLCMTHLPA